VSDANEELARKRSSIGARRNEHRLECRGCGSDHFLHTHHVGDDRRRDEVPLPTVGTLKVLRVGQPIETLTSLLQTLTVVVPEGEQGPFSSEGAVQSPSVSQIFGVIRLFEVNIQPLENVPKIRSVFTERLESGCKCFLTLPSSSVYELDLPVIVTGPVENTSEDTRLLIQEFFADAPGFDELLHMLWWHVKSYHRGDSCH
jgi:hypothetical protein